MANRTAAKASTKKPAGRRISKTSPQPTPSTASKKSSASGVRVRMYRVGFGDFFLVTLQTPAGPQHILIDCGVHAGDIGSIGDAVSDMAKETNSTLALIIMTHRHADHISGFAKCKQIFSGFTIERVWMPWFENPQNATARAFQANLVAVAEKLRLSLAAREDEASKEYRLMAENITGDAFGAAGGASNDVALQVLHGGFKNKAPVDYYKAGDTADLPTGLVSAGLTAQILGPPIDPALVKQMDGKNHQYLMFDDVDVIGMPLSAFDSNFVGTASLYPAEAFGNVTPTGLEKVIADVQPDIAAAKARQADNTLNNQSLVVLFTFNGKKLLFVGDAQWGNWQNFLYGGPIGQAAHITQQSSDILKSIDFYKVGHHGSTNATPIDALEAMHEGVTAMCSTQPGCYGSASRGTEVPRLPLLDALSKKADGRVARSDQITVGKNVATKGAEPLDAAFSAGSIYIDYEL